MSDKDKFEQWVSAVGLELGLNEPFIDNNGCCSFLFDDAVSVTLSLYQKSGCSGSSLLLYSPLYSLQSHNEQSLLSCLQLAMKANFGWLETIGGTLAMDEDGSCIVLTQDYLIEGMDYPDFFVHLQSFIDKAFGWSNRLQETATSSGASPSSDIEVLKKPSGRAYKV